MSSSAIWLLLVSAYSTGFMDMVETKGLQSFTEYVTFFLPVPCCVRSTFPFRVRISWFSADRWQAVESLYLSKEMSAMNLG